MTNPLDSADSFDPRVLAAKTRVKDKDKKDEEERLDYLNTFKGENVGNELGPDLGEIKDPFNVEQRLIIKAFEVIKNITGKVVVYKDGRIDFGRSTQRFTRVLPFIKEAAKEDVELTKLLFLDENYFHHQLYSYYISLSKEETGALRRKTKKSQSFIPDGFYGFDWNGLIPFQSITDANNYVIYDAKYNRITDYDYRTFKQATKNFDDTPEPLIGRIGFDPYRPLPLWDIEDEYGRKMKFINTYQKPEWQLNQELSEQGMKAFTQNMPRVLIKFFTHLFPLDTAREFVLDWLHFALVNRCETYLVLNGAKGAGKNVLAEHICRQVMGKNNHKMAQPGALESNFNALLEKSRMIVLDEFKIDTQDKINKLKRYVNEDQMIEKKGQDVNTTSKTYNSFIICNNHETDMAISWDDRRFSVVDMNNEKLEETLEEEEIESLIRMDEATLKHFGYYLMYRKPKVMKNEFHVYKGSHFYNLCYTSLPRWGQVIVDLIESGEYEILEMDEIRRELKRKDEYSRMPKRQKVRDFLKNYKHKGKHYLGEIEIEKGNYWHIKVNPEYVLDVDEDEIGLL